MTTTATTKRGLGRTFALGLAYSFLAACGANGTIATNGEGSSASSSGGGIPGGGGSSGGSSNSIESSSAGSTSSQTGGASSSAMSSGGSSSGTSSGAATSSESDSGSGSSSGTSTGGGIDAGGSSSGRSGGSGEGGTAGCPAGAAFCDDFEASATLGSAWTTDNTLGATVKVVNTYATTPGPTMAHSGTNSVQIGFTTGSGYAMLVEKAGFPAPMGYWGRVWLYIETPTTDAGHDVYIEGSTGMNLGNNGVRPLNTQRGDMTINIDPVGTGEAGANTTTAIPRGAWTCFEWQISATSGTGDVVLYAGGATMPTVSLKAQPIGALTEQRVGYERYAAGTAGNLWIDDYVIGPARLGCM
jgi:hypothetical protein